MVRFPCLDSLDYTTGVLWCIQFEESLRELEGTRLKKVPLGAVVRGRVRTALGTLPEDDNPRTLLAMLAPTDYVSRKNLLKACCIANVRFGMHAGWTTVNEFCTEFAIRAETLRIRDDKAIKILLKRALPDPLRSAARGKVEEGSAGKLDAALKLLRDIARGEDEHSDLWRPTKAVATPTPRAPSATPLASGPKAGSRSDRPAPPPKGKPQYALSYGLSRQEYQRCKDEHRWFRCFAEDHLSSQCPVKQETSPQATAVRAGTSSAAAAAANQQSVTYSRGSQASGRPRSKSASQRPATHNLITKSKHKEGTDAIEEVDAGHSAVAAEMARDMGIAELPSREELARAEEAQQGEVFDVAETGTTPRASATAATQQDPVVAAEGPVGNVPRGDSRAVTIVTPTDGHRTFTAIVDPGAERSHMNTRMQQLLQLQPRTIEPRRFRTAGGNQFDVTQSVRIQVKLLPEAPDQSIEFFVCPEIPSGEYAIIGRADLDFFVLNVMPNHVTLEYSGIHRDDDDGMTLVPNLSTRPEEQAPCIDLAPTAGNEQGRAKPLWQLIGAEEQHPRWMDVLVGKVGQRPENLLTVRAFLERHAHCFDLPGIANVEPYHIELTDATPFQMPIRPMSREKLEFAQREIDAWLKAGKLRASKSPFRSSCLVVQNNGKMRSCINYVRLNKVTRPDGEPMDDQEDIIRWMAQFTVFGKKDQKGAYMQIPCDRQTSEYLAFALPQGQLLEPTVMTFGSCNAPGHYHRVARTVFSGCRNTRIWFDDHPTGGTDFTDYMQAEEEYFQVCEERNLKLAPEKTIIAAASIPLLGKIVSGRSVGEDPDKLSAIANMRAPEAKKELERFLGVINYHARFIPNMSTTAAPLRKLLHKDQEWAWTPECQQTFQRLKEGILQAQPLAQPRVGATMLLRTDASEAGIGGAIMQESRSKDTWELLMYFAQALSPTQSRYSTTEAECLAIITGFAKGRGMLLSAGKIFVVADHSNLTWMQHSVNRRVQRWMLSLGEFRFTIVYAPGAENDIADTLSRLLPGTHAAGRDVPMAVEPVEEDTTALGQAVKTDLQHLVEAEPGKSMVDNVIVFDHRPRKEIVEAAIALCHSDTCSGHFGYNKTLKLLDQAVRWGGMTADVRDFVKRCAACQKVKAQVPAPGEILYNPGTKLYESIFIDFLGPLEEDHGFRYILVVVDRFSHAVMLIPTRSTTANETIDALWTRWMCVKEIPARITTDGGPPFNAKAMAAFLKSLSATHHISCVGHPEGHGAVERMIRTVEQVIRCKFVAKTRWVPLVASVAFAINTVVNRMTGRSPFEIEHGFAPRLPIHRALGLDARTPFGRDDDSDAGEFADKLCGHVLQIRDEVRRIENENFKKEVERIGSHAQKKDAYKVGDFVLVHRSRPPKLLLEWTGPFEVIEKEGPYIYTVRSLVNNDEKRVHANALHRFVAGVLSREQLTVAALEHDELIVERVLGHRTNTQGQYEYHIQAAALPGDPTGGSDMWLPFFDCHAAPKVKEYNAAHHLHPRLR